MCDPFSAMAIAGTGLQMFGALQKGAIGSRTAGIQGDIARANVDVLNQQSDLALEGVDLAYAKERLTDARISRAGDAVLAGQFTQTTARHFDPTYGSPLVIQAFTAGQIKSDLEIARAGAAIEAADAYARAASLRSSALGQLGNAFGADMRGEAARTAAVFGAGTAFLNTAAKFKPGGGKPGADWLSNPFGEE